MNRAPKRSRLLSAVLSEPFYAGHDDIIKTHVDILGLYLAVHNMFSDSLPKSTVPVPTRTRITVHERRMI